MADTSVDEVAGPLDPTDPTDPVDPTDPAGNGSRSETGSLSDRAARGAGWTAIGFGLNKLVIFGTSAVLAHLLTPREFGLVAIAMVIVGYVERLSEGGLESAVITFPGPDRRVFDHALGISLVLGVSAAIIGLITAPLIGSVFSEPDATPVVAALSILYLTTSVRQTLAGALARRMQFARRVGPELARGLTKAVVMVGMAFAGFGVWALTIGHLVGAGVGLVAYWLAVGERVRPRLSRPTTPALFRLGLSFSAVSLLGTVLQNIDYVMLGIRADSAAVGFYSIGFRIPEFTVLAIPVVASHSLMASFSRLTENPVEMAKGYLMSLRLLAVILVPVGVGMALVADDTVPLLFGDRWDRSVPVVQLVGFYGVAVGLAFPFGDAIKAAGKARVLVQFASARLVLAIPVLWVAAGRGLRELAAAQLLMAVAGLAVTLVLARHLLQVSLEAQMASLRGAIIAALVMVAAVSMVRSGLAPGPLRLVASVLAGAGAYGAVLLMLDRTAIDRISALVPARRMR